MTRALTFALALLSAFLALPGVSSAATWRTVPASFTGGVARNQIAPGETLYMYSIDASGTLVLDTGRCRGGVDIFFDSNMVSASPSTGNVIALEWCSTATYSANTCNGIYYDVDGGAVDTNEMNGDAAAGKAAVYGVLAPYLAVSLTNAGLVQATAKCWQ